jgi:hypothetical protein
LEKKMKKAIATFTLGLALTAGSTFAHAGIIVAGRAESTEPEGGIIVAGHTASTNCAE